MLETVVLVFANGSRRKSPRLLSVLKLPET